MLMLLLLLLLKLRLRLSCCCCCCADSTGDAAAAATADGKAVALTTPPPVLSFQATPKNKVDVSTHDTSFVCETEHSKSYAFSMSRDGKDCLIRFGTTI